MPDSLKITATINGPIAYNRHEGISLDGPLLYHATKQRLGERFFTEAPANAELARLTAVPDPATGLAVHEGGDTWCYCISMADIHGDYGTELHHWNKRFDDNLAGELLDRGALGKLKKIHTGSGAFKSYHQPLYCEVVERLIWYALGDTERLRTLLPHVVSLGKKRQTGEGRVLRWDIEEGNGPADRWLWREPDVLARPVPLAMLPAWQGDREYCAFRPPYWLPSNQTLCAVPGR